MFLQLPILVALELIVISQLIKELKLEPLLLVVLLGLRSLLLEVGLKVLPEGERHPQCLILIMALLLVFIQHHSYL